ncbi:MAG: hypothetical protein H7Z39_19525, partial [Burkholderiaceae bacterium]|nr:hypothetical protein [Burkholderiaceae bacterium]
QDGVAPQVAASTALAARFFAEHQLARAAGLASSIRNGGSSLLDFSDDDWLI